jgi:hypothetical protein
MDRQKTSAVVALDISAAFDSIDFDILTERLHVFFGVSGTALGWIRSYLTSRQQYVKIDDVASPAVSLQSGVPQGSVLGPVLFSTFIAPLAGVISTFNIQHQQYADDTQIFHCFNPANSSDHLLELSTCLDAVYVWYLTNGLMVNPGKSDALLVGTSVQRQKVTLNGVSMCGTMIPFSDSIRSLGVTLDSDLNMNKHINEICRSCMYHIRALRSIRPSLDEATAVAIGRSIVMARVDYCNGILAGTTAKNIKKLQRIQDTLARVVTNAAYRQSSGPILFKLHWLPIEHRIQFKILTFAFRFHCGTLPEYLAKNLALYKPVRELRSSCRKLLTEPRAKTELVKRSFSFIAPHLWNSLPDEIMQLSSPMQFKTRIKTYLFKIAFN